MEAAFRLMKRDAAHLGYQELSTIIAEFDNPERKAATKFGARASKAKRAIQLNYQRISG